MKGVASVRDMQDMFLSLCELSAGHKSAQETMISSILPSFSVAVNLKISIDFPKR